MTAVKTSSTTYIIEPVPDHPPPSYLRKHFYMHKLTQINGSCLRQCSCLVMQSKLLFFKQCEPEWQLNL